MIGSSSDAAARLVKLAADAKQPKPDFLPQHLPHSKIEKMPELFQFRSGISERHIADLVRAIHNVGDLDPVIVIQVGQRAVLIDGHHRLDAYELADRTARIPVEYFDGSLDEAVLFAGTANTKAKLPMSTTERQDCAWRLVLLGLSYSKAEIAEAGGVSTAQVGNMRKVKRQLGDTAADHSAWWRARLAARGEEREMSDEDRETWKQETANDWADTLAKAFSTKLIQQPEIAAMAFDIYFGRRLADFVSELRGFVRDEDADETDF